MLNSEPDCTKCGAVLTQHIPKLHKIGMGSVGKDKDHMQQLIKKGWTPLLITIIGASIVVAFSVMSDL